MNSSSSKEETSKKTRKLDKLDPETGFAGRTAFLTTRGVPQQWKGTSAIQETIAFLLIFLKNKYNSFFSFIKSNLKHINIQNTVNSGKYKERKNINEISNIREMNECSLCVCLSQQLLSEGFSSIMHTVKSPLDSSCPKEVFWQLQRSSCKRKCGLLRGN